LTKIFKRVKLYSGKVGKNVVKDFSKNELKQIQIEDTNIYQEEVSS